MCLHSIDKKATIISEGYKVFLRTPKHYFNGRKYLKYKYSIMPEHISVDFNMGLPKHKWVNRYEPPLLLNVPRSFETYKTHPKSKNYSKQTYFSGFHVFVSLSDAINYIRCMDFVIHRVLIKDIIISGDQAYYVYPKIIVCKAVVCKQIYIMEELKMNALKD